MREEGEGAGLGQRPRAWSDGTHCVFCMLFSIPFHPLPELSIHGLRGKSIQCVTSKGRPRQWKVHRLCRMTLDKILVPIYSDPVAEHMA